LFAVSPLVDEFSGAGLVEREGLEVVDGGGVFQDACCEDC
jgi:hypothetical protein